MNDYDELFDLANVFFTNNQFGQPHSSRFFKETVKDDTIEYRIEIPGWKKEHVKIHVRAHADRKDELFVTVDKDGRGRNYILDLPSGLSGGDASLEDGVLCITFNTEKKKNRMIEIK